MADDNLIGWHLGDLENANTDRSVSPPVMVRGIMGRDATGTWRYLAASASGYLLVSGSFGGSVTTAPLSADSSSISAIQGDAGLLRVSALGTFTSTPQNDTVSTASFSAVGNSHIVPVSAGQNTVAIFLSGFGTGQINFAVTVDGTNYVAHDFINSQTHQIVNATGSDGLYFAGVAGFKQVRLSATSWSSGVVSATTEIATGTQSVHLESSLPEGTNNIGNVSAVQGVAGNLRISAFSNDGGLMRVSAIGSTTSPLSASSSSISAINGDAGTLHVSSYGGYVAGNKLSGYGGLTNVAAGIDTNGVIRAFETDTTGNLAIYSPDAGVVLVSSKQGDAGLLHVSAFMDSGSVSAKSADANQLHVSAVQGDAGLFRVSSIGGSFSLSADASGNRVSAIQGDAGLLHVSSFWAQRLDAANDTVSAVQGDAGLLRVSSIGGTFSLSADAVGNRVSAFSQDGNQVHVSAVQGDAGLFHVSAIGTITVSAHEVKQSDAASLRVSAINQDANFMHVSAVGTITVSAHEVKQSDAAALRVSAILAAGVSSVGAASFGVSAAQADAGALRVSASLFPDTTGGLTVFQTLSVSASQSVKSGAGALYGYYLYNSDTHYNFVKLFNVSGAANIGTDTPLMTIGLPPSAAANVEYPHGLAGFTAGINITATSGRALDNTAAPAASSVGAVLFYK